MFHTVAEITEPAQGSHTLDAVPSQDRGWPGQNYLDGLQRGELYFQRCRWCHTAAYHRLLCPICASTDLDWERSSGSGLVRHTTVVRRPNGALRTIAVIDMAEGFRLRATLAGVAPDTVRPGTTVSLDSSAAYPRELTFRIGDSRAVSTRSAWR